MTQPRFKIKKGDHVQVMTGSAKGSKGVVLEVLLHESKVVVSGVRRVTRHVRPSEKHPEGKYEKNLPIHISNVALIDPVVREPGKVFYDISGEEKIRRFKRSGVELPVPNHRK